VVEQCHTIANNQRAETRLRRSAHQDAISGSQRGSCGRAHKDGSVAVLDKEQAFISARITYRGFEGHGNRLSGLNIRQGVNGLQRSNGSGRRCPRSRGPTEKNREGGSESLHLKMLSIANAALPGCYPLYRQSLPCLSTPPEIHAKVLELTGFHLTLS
jgi:hypothetical protein